MKYCLTSRQPKAILDLADEILLYYKDFNQITDLIETYPNKPIIIDLDNNIDIEEIDWNFIASCNTQTIIFCKVYNFTQIKYCKNFNLKFFSGLPVESFYELQQLEQLGVSYIYLGPELFFNYAQVKKKIVPIRLIPNVVNNGYMSQDNGLLAPWVRPEDIDLYREDSVCEFYLNNPKIESPLVLEKTLFNIYSNQKEWKGSVDDIITYLKTYANNKSFIDNFGLYRQECKNSCLKGRPCHLCLECVKFSTTLQTK